jgi:hypothetical protein
MGTIDIEIQMERCLFFLSSVATNAIKESLSFRSSSTITYKIKDPSFEKMLSKQSPPIGFGE